MAADLDFASAEELVGLIRQRALSPTELIDHTFKRIAELNPKLNAFVQLDEERARREAAEQTDRLMKGEDLGPLGGLPLGVKDMENVAGMNTTKGSLVFKDNLATEDDVNVRRLRRAGAIIIGKTNTPEFAHLTYTTNRLFGTTRNPWNLERTPGGSSGGSSAAVASGMIPLATASDGAGSIRIPACFTGLYGLKVTFGRVPITPGEILTWSDNGVYGPLARTVRDAAIYLDQVVGYDPVDPNSLPHPGYSYAQKLDEPLPPLRIAYSPLLGIGEVQPDIAREVDKAVEAFRDMGHTISEHNAPIPDIIWPWVRIRSFQFLASLANVYPERHDDFTPAFVAQLDSAQDIGPKDFREFYMIRKQLNEWMRQLFEEYDLLLTPTIGIEPFPAEGPIVVVGEGKNLAAAHCFTYSFSFSGHPAASVRAGFTDSGLPCGLQIVAPRYRDDLVLQASAAYERERPWNQWPKL